MRTATETNVLETGGAVSAWRSTIKSSRKTFRMVIDGIYSDKFGSIVREIAANAWDSHRRAGTEKPFYIHCPTALKPEFFIRDYGVGMTPEVIQEVYIVLGESDKDLSDEEVGMWGLGSKSPFAYADQYTVSCFDGEQVRHYGYGVAEDGVPTLYLMDTEPSDEPKGVRVGFAVESQDFHAFQKAINSVAVAHEWAFETNAPLPKAGEIAFEGNDWKCLLGVEGFPAGWYARQGCVIYPINPQQVSQPQAHYSRQHVFILDCPIGTVKVTTSRESIQYEPDVVEYLRGRIEGTLEEIKEAVWQKVKDIKSVTEFFKTLEKIKPSFLNASFTHPVTGLTSPSVRADWPGLFFEVSFESSGRWEFRTPATIDLSKDQPTKNAFVLDDLSPLLDPSRDGTESKGLSKSEIRRISRFSRSYLEANNLHAASFFLNLGWSEDFWEACFPKMITASITFDELRRAVPRRIVPPKTEIKPPIKGIALAKGAGEQKPVFEIAPQAEGAALVAWVSSEQYRRQASALFKLTKTFGISALYISAPASQHLLTDAGIDHLRVVIEQKMADKGTSFSDWYYTREKLTEYNVKSYIDFLRSLVRKAPKAYTKLARSKGVHSAVAKGVRRLLQADLPTFSEDEGKAIDVLLVNNAGQSIKPTIPPEFTQLEEALRLMRENSYYNPTCKFAREMPTAATPEQLARLAESLIVLQTIIPASEKFK